jgi:hypothetical protein
LKRELITQFENGYIINAKGFDAIGRPAPTKTEPSQPITLREGPLAGGFKDGDLSIGEFGHDVLLIRHVRLR